MFTLKFHETEAAVKTLSKNNKGFTLIEMAFVLVIFSVIVVSFGHLYTQYIKHQRIETTKLNISKVVENIGSFRSMHGRYPCPASLTETRGDVNYGRETDCADESIPVGTCADGICIEEKITAITDEESGIEFHPRVRAGFVSFRELNMEEPEAYDGYNSRLVYIVTERLAVSSTFAATDGGIEIRNETGNSAIAPPESAHFMIISHGPNAAGAFVQNGTQPIPCPAGGLEAENCNIGTQSIYSVAQISRADGAAQFDDVVEYFTREEVPLWQQSEEDTFDIHHKPVGQIGIKVSGAATLQTEGQIGGVVAVRDDPNTNDGNPLTRTDIEGKIYSNSLCTYGRTDCFPTNKIAGSLASGGGLECEDGEFMKGIANGEPICEEEVVLRCPANKLMIGINPDGSLNCDIPPPADCSEQIVQLCGEDRTLPGGYNHWQTYQITAGSTGIKTQTFRCQDGTWVSLGTSGVCECSTTVIGQDAPCEYGFSGTRYQENTYTCPYGTWSGWVTIDDSKCECESLVQTQSFSCPPGYTGHILQGREHVCDPPPGAWTDWEVLENTCTCTPDTQDRTLNCTGGLEGTYTERRDFTCTPTPHWGDWYQTSWNCVCNPVTEQEPFPCPPNHTGEILKERSFVCTPTPHWTDWVDVPGGNSCVPVPPVVCSWEDTGSGSSGSFAIGQELSTQCSPCSSTGPCYRQLSPGNYINYPVCVCE